MSQGSIIVAPESTYGTAPATGWRELPATADSIKTKRDVLRPGGFRAGTGAPIASGARVIMKGAAGPVPIEGLSNGLGVMNATVFDTSTTTLHSGGTLANDQTFGWGASGPAPSKSVTVETRRPRTDGTFDAFTYTGGRATQLDIAQDDKGFLALTYAMDFQTATRQTTLPTRTIAVVEPDVIYAWQDATITLAKIGNSGVATCVSAFDLTLPTGLKTDKYCLKRGSSRHEPMRAGTPAPTGKMEWDYSDPQFYDAFVNGEIWFLSANWQGPTAIEGSTYPSLTIAVAAIQYSGDDPEMKIDDLTTQSLPFDVLSLDDGNPEVTMSYVTSDAAL